MRNQSDDPCPCAGQGTGSEEISRQRALPTCSLARSHDLGRGTVETVSGPCASAGRRLAPGARPITSSEARRPETSIPRQETLTALRDRSNGPAAVDRDPCSK